MALSAVLPALYFGLTNKLMKVPFTLSMLIFLAILHKLSH
jgi:hypothetical protein